MLSWILQLHGLCDRPKSNYALLHGRYVPLFDINPHVIVAEEGQILGSPYSIRIWNNGLESPEELSPRVSSGCGPNVEIVTDLAHELVRFHQGDVLSQAYSRPVAPSEDMLLHEQGPVLALKPSFGPEHMSIFPEDALVPLDHVGICADLGSGRCVQSI